MLSPRTWDPPPQRPVLTRAEVHVWKSSLSQPIMRVRALERTLAADERVRVNRFFREEDRTRFIVARGVLRTILGCYLGREPGRLQFDYGPRGKPALWAESGMQSIRFNVSHSGAMALYAVTSEREVGVDIERVRPDFGSEEIAERFFSEPEGTALRALPAESRLEAFFACWTRKEAYIKARGKGLSLSLNRFDVSLAPGQPAALLNVHHDSKEAARWSLRDLFPGPDHVAALAAEGHAWRLKCWQWPELSFVQCHASD